MAWFIFSSGLASDPDTALFYSCAMEILFVRLFLVLAPVIWAPPSWGDDPYSWRRPVPGWRQSKESVTLENRGFKFEEAEFESHFRDEGRKFGNVDQVEVLLFIK